MPLSQNMSSAELCRFRTKKCPRKSAQGVCELEERCPFSHCLSWHRRNPTEYEYRPNLCPNVDFTMESGKMRVKNRCTRGRVCLYAHTKEEQMYHPLVYKTQMCRDWPNCTKAFCPFSHGISEIRSPQDIMSSSINNEDIGMNAYLEYTKECRNNDTHNNYNSIHTLAHTEATKKMFKKQVKDIINQNNMHATHTRAHTDTGVRTGNNTYSINNNTHTRSTSLKSPIMFKGAVKPGPSPRSGISVSTAASIGSKSPPSHTSTHISEDIQPLPPQVLYTNPKKQYTSYIPSAISHPHIHTSTHLSNASATENLHNGTPPPPPLTPPPLTSHPSLPVTHLEEYIKPHISTSNKNVNEYNINTKNTFDDLYNKNKTFVGEDGYVYMRLGQVGEENIFNLYNIKNNTQNNCEDKCDILEENTYKDEDIHECIHTCDSPPNIYTYINKDKYMCPYTDIKKEDNICINNHIYDDTDESDYIYNNNNNNNNLYINNLLYDLSELNEVNKVPCIDTHANYGRDLFHSKCIKENPSESTSGYIDSHAQTQTHDSPWLSNATSHDSEDVYNLIQAAFNSQPFLNLYTYIDNEEVNKETADSMLTKNNTHKRDEFRLPPGL